jgi:hypothetical protein
MVAYAKGGPDTVDLAHAHLEVEALSQGGLKGWTWRVGSLSTGAFEKGSYLPTQFRGVTVPSVLQSDVPFGTDSTK